MELYSLTGRGSRVELVVGKGEQDIHLKWTKLQDSACAARIDVILSAFPCAERI